MQNLRGVSQQHAGKCAALFAACFICTGVGASRAAATGFVRLESSGFLKRSNDRSNSSSTVVLGPRFQTRGRIAEAEIDARAIGYTSDRSSLSIESKNAFVATSQRLMPHHQATLGRRFYDWSAADDDWKLGLWSPRFLWDPLRPEQIGLTGAFYTYESKAWRVLAYASPLSIPERGFPVRQENGTMVSSSPFHIAPYQYVMMQGQKIPVRYNVQYPPMEKLLLNPGAAMGVRYGAKEGAWAQGIYGFMPIHQVNVSISPAYVLQQDYIEVPIHPRVLHHHVLTGESGYKTRDWSLYGSTTAESPVKKDIPENWMTAPVEQAILASVGGSARLSGGFKLSSSFLYIYEKKNSPAEKSMNIALPSRFPYNRAVKVSGEWDGQTKLTYGLGLTSDLSNRSSLVSFDMNFHPGLKEATEKTGAWMLNVGTDFFTSTTGKGQIGQYVGNDRIRGGLAYAF